MYQLVTAFDNSGKFYQSALCLPKKCNSAWHDPNTKKVCHHIRVKLFKYRYVLLQNFQSEARFYEKQQKTEAYQKTQNGSMNTVVPLRGNSLRINPPLRENTAVNNVTLGQSDPPLLATLSVTPYRSICLIYNQLCSRGRSSRWWYSSKVNGLTVLESVGDAMNSSSCKCLADVSPHDDRILSSDLNGSANRIAATRV